MGAFDDLIPAKSGGGAFDDLIPQKDEGSSRSALDAAGDVGAALLKGAVGLPAAVVGLADIPTGGRVGKALEEVGYRPGDAKAIIDDWYSNEQKAANAAVQNADGFVDTLVAGAKNPSAVAGAAIESLPQMLGGAGVARGVLKVAPKVAPWLAAAGGEGVLAAGAAAAEARDKSADGLLSDRQALAALGAGAGTAAFGAAGGKLAQRFGLGDVDTMLAAGTSKLSKAPPGFVRQVIGSGISEGVFEELPQSIQEKMWENWGAGRPLDEGVGNAAAMGLMTGTAMGVAGGGVSAVRNRGGQLEQPPAAEAGAAGAAGAPAGAPVDAAELLGEAPAAGAGPDAAAPGAAAGPEASAAPPGANAGAADASITPGAGQETTVSAPDPLTAEPSAPSALPPVRAVPGLATSFTTETGPRLDAQYALVEADELQTSHDVNLRTNPNYPPELQPRQRERAASAQQIASIVGRLDPARLGLSADAATGAPIIGEDGLVESGNARTIAVKRVYQANGQKAEDYRGYLRANAAQFGLTPEQIDGMQRPVLVRLRTTPVNRAEFARQANASTVAQMAPSEMAKADSNRIDSLEDLRPDDSGDFATSREFIRRFMAKLPGTEQAGMIDAGGRLSSAGYARVRNAVLAKAYGDSPVLTRMVESMDDNQRNITKALMIAAPRVAQARSAIAEGRRFDADITPHLVSAAESLSALKDAGTSIDDALAQAGLLGDEFTPETRELLRFLAENTRRPRKIADFISAYFDALDAAGDPAQGSLLGDTQAPTTTDLMGAARRSTQATTGATDATGNAQDPQRRDDREAAPAGDSAAGQPADAARGRGGAEGDGAAGAGANPNVEGEPQDSDWVKFAPDSGSAGIPRSHLPQFPAEANGALTNFLKARGIKHRILTVKASRLKPSQAEYSPTKVERAGQVDTGAAIPVSSDGYVIDGHHRWLSKLASNDTIKIMRLDKPLQEVLDAATNFPSAEVDPDSPVAKRAAAVAEFKDAAGDLARVLTKHQRAAMVPEDTPGLMDALTRLFTAAVKIVGTDLRAATKWVREQMRLDPALKPLANKIDPATFKKAAQRALEQTDVGDMLGGLARQPGETDKAFAKRVVDKRPVPTALPENHADYFKMDGAQVVPVADLISTKTAEQNQEGGENGAKRMAAAAAGEIAKRGPITVMPAQQAGKFEVVDGNGTLTSIGRYGWKALPVTVVSREEGLRQMAEDKAKEAAKAPQVAMIDGRPYDMKRDNFKPPRTDEFMQQELVDLARGYIEKFAAEAPPLALDPAVRAEAEAVLKPMLEQAAAAQVGYDQKVIDIAKRTGALGQRLAPLKGIKRAAEKLSQERRKPDGTMDGSAIKDLLRSTIVVSSYADAQAVVDEIYREFKVLPRRVKDRTNAGIKAPDLDTKQIGFLPTGYGDVLINVQMPNGTVAEIQINVPEMLAAKENEGHKLYEISRDQPEGSDTQKAVEAAQVDYYLAAARAATARAQSKKNSSVVKEPERGSSATSNKSPDSSSSLNTLPSGKRTKSSPDESLTNREPGGNLDGTSTAPILQAQTPEELKAKASREKAAADADAAEQRQLQNKATADAERDRFELTGSDRPADAAGQNSLFSRGTGGGMPFRDLLAVSARVTRDLPGLPNVNVLRSAADAPKALRDFIERRGATSDVEGALHQGQIYLFASGIADAERAEHVLAEHEAAHAGLRAVLGPRLKAAMQVIANENADIRRAARPLIEGGMSIAEAIEEVIVDIPSARLARLKGWRKVVGKVRDTLKARGFERLAAQLDGWLDGHLTDQQRADLFVADLVREARAFVARKSGAGQPAGTVLAGPQKLADDLAAQEKWLLAQAKAAGHADIEALLAADYPLFERLAAQWREEHPSDVMLSTAAAAPAGGPTAAERADAIIQTAASTPAPLDAAFKAATKVTGIQRATTMLYGLGARLIDRITPEYAKAGLISDYGVPEAVIDQRAQMQGSQREQLQQAGKLLEKLATMTRAESRVAYEWMSGDDTRTADELMKALPEASVKVLLEVRDMVDKLSQEALRLGQLDAEAFKRHRFAYLRRSYFKHATDLTPGEKTARTRAISILGDQYKGRGMTAKAPMRQIQNVAPEWWKRKLVDGKADTSLKGEKFERLERRAPKGEGTVGLEGMGENTRPGKLLEVHFWPVGEAKPAKYADWESAGTWEVRDTKGGDLVLWRDFTKPEREKMGEIDEARYAIAKTLHRMVHDVEVGRYLEWLAQRHAKKPGEEIDGPVVDASERYLDAFKPGEWVQVPDTKIPGTSVMKYGALAGRYLPGPIWNDLRQVVGGRFQPLGETYQKVLSMWKTSKALALDTPIPTPSGWTTMGAISVGDEVFDERGQVCVVLGATPVQYERECFEVAFSDGTKIVADAEHRWFTIRQGRPGVRTTEEIKSTLRERTRGDANHKIPVAAPLDLPDVELPFPPYVLGAWLGDGDSKRARITQGSADAPELIAHLEAAGVRCAEPRQDTRSAAMTFWVRRGEDGCIRGHGAAYMTPRGDCRECANLSDRLKRRGELLPPGQHPSIQERLRFMGLLGNKHIPAAYLRGSEAQRRDLLMGLMDTDGHITERGECSFTTTSPALRDGILELLRSLGYKPTAREWQPSCRGKPGKPAWSIGFKAYIDKPVFRLERKRARLKEAPRKRQRSQTRQIVSITPVPSVPVRCIAVSSKSKLYLAGDGMVPTHNTALSPGVHTNNVMSNFVMADWHDVSAGHVSKALRILLAAQQGDGKGVIGRTGNAAARLGIADREAAREVLNRYQVSGGAIGGWITQEIANDQIEPIVAALQAEVAATAAAAAPTEIGVYSALQHLLHARFAPAWEAFKASRPAAAVATDAQNLIDLYQAEDDVFRLAAWLKAKEGGASDGEAGKASRKSFLDYSINAPWVAAMRATAFPFIAYTYRAVPMLLETFAKKPHKILKLMAMAGALNWLGVMLAGGGDDKERKLLPDEKAGGIWGLVPKLIRMPWNDANGSPVYLDVRRWIPVGDVVDLGQGQAALPLPPAAYPGGPLVILGEIIFNKSAFTGKPITLETDTATEKAGKLIDHLWKAAMPNILGVPGTYATEGVVGAVKGRTDAFGREMSVPMAMSSAMGVKLGGYPEDVLRRNLLAKKAAQEAEIDKQIADLKRQRRTNRVDDEELTKGLQQQNAKKQELARKLAEQLQ